MKDIIKTRNIIRKKYKALKSGRIESETLLEDAFKSITKPLKELVEKTESNRHELKEEAPYKSKAIKTPEKLEWDDYLPVTEETARKFFDSPQGSTSLQQYFKHEKLDDLPAKYLKIYATQKGKIDQTYGIYYDNDSYKWKVGNSDINIDNSDIFIKNKSYKGSKGLYELLFMKNPNKNLYTADDLNNYKTILNDTSAHKRYYDPDGQINGSKSIKYKEIISKLMHREGRGLFKQLTKGWNEYVYWDDPNELVDRLRLLIASQQAGHNNHNNEIISIIEELKEADIIV